MALVRQGGEIELLPVGEVRGRLTDQDGRPIAGAASRPRSSGSRPSRDSATRRRSVRETAAPYRTTTAADGSFALKGIPQGSLVEAKITAPKAAAAHGSPGTRPRPPWPSPSIIASDASRAGSNRPMDAGSSGQMRVHVSIGWHRRGTSAPGPVSAAL